MLHCNVVRNRRHIVELIWPFECMDTRFGGSYRHPFNSGLHGSFRGTLAYSLLSAFMLTFTGSKLFLQLRPAA